MQQENCYQFKENALVVIKSAHGKHIRVEPNNMQNVDGNGGIDEYAQWCTELHQPHLLRLKSAKSGKYLRIHNEGASIDAEGVGGENCIFKYHFVGESLNTVKLESKNFEGCYVSVSHHHHVEIGEGGAHCHLQFYSLDNQMNYGGNVNEVPVQVQQDLNFAQQQKQELQQQQLQQQQLQQQQLQQQQQQQLQQQQQNQMQEMQTPVGQWLKSLNLSQYTDVFIKNGFDQLSNVGNITENDLKQMNVELGHVKTILNAAQHVLFVGHIVSIRGIRWQLFLKAKAIGKHDHGEATSEDKLDGFSKWKVIELPNGKIALENVQEPNCYLSLPNKDNEQVRIQTHIQDWETLQIERHPQDASKYVLKCPTNATYLAINESKFIGANPVHAVFNPKDESKIDIEILE